MRAEPASRWRFGEFVFDPRRGRLFRAGDPVDLPHKAAELLALLIVHRGRVVEKAEIFDALWPQVAVQESNLTQTVYVLRKALGDAKESAEYVRTVPRRGYAFVAAVGEEAAAPAPAEPPSRPSVHPSSRPGRARTLVTLAATALAVMAAWTAHPPRPAVPAESHAPASGLEGLKPLRAPRRSVAVLALRNLGRRPEQAWLGHALAELLSAELVRHPRLRSIPAERVSHAGADLVVSGAYAIVGEGGARQLRVEARVQETATGDVLGDVSQTGTDEDLLALSARLGSRLLAAVDGSGAAARGALGLPDSNEAMRLYASGLERLRAFDSVAARGHLEQAVKLSPRSPLAHLALSQAWRALGHDVRARESAEEADRLAEGLAPERRLAIQAHHLATAHEWARAAEVGASLVRLFPDEIEHVLRRAEAETRAGRGREALAALAAARGRPGLDASDPRLWLAEAEAHGALGDNDAQGQAAERAREQAAARGATHLEASALSARAWALRNAGRTAEAESAAARARAVFAAAGDRNAEAFALNIVAAARSDLGRHEEALALWGECLAMRRAAGNLRGVAIIQNNRGTVLTWQGRLDEARATYAEVVRIAVEVADRRLESIARYNEARILFGEGQIEEARRSLEQALGLARQIEDRGSEPMMLLELTRVAMAQARLADAEALQDQTERSAAAANQVLVTRAAALGRFDLLLARGDHAGARRVAEDLRRRQEASRNPSGVRDAEIALSMVLLEQQRPAEAEPLARGAYEHWTREGNEIRAGTAAHHLARALWMQGRRADARRLFEQASRAVWRAGQRRHYAELRAERARFEGLDGAPAAAATLAETLDEAQRRGWEKAALEIRLALGEVEMKRAPARGRARLASLGEEARQKGLEAVAARAQELLGRPLLARAGR